LVHKEALVLLLGGDDAGYRQLCRKALEQLGGSTNPDDGRAVARTCALAADAVADWKPIVTLAERALAHDAKDCGNLHSLGAVLYRAGRLADAVKRLKEAEATPSHKFNPYGWDWAFLALAHHGLKDSKAATEAWSKTQAILDQDRWSRYLGLVERLELQLLRREAQKVLPPEIISPRSKGI
jgi:hypothetical protein